MGKQIKLGNRLQSTNKQDTVVSLEKGWKVFEKRNNLKDLAKSTIVSYEDKVYKKFFDWLLKVKGINNVRLITKEVIEDYTIYLKGTDLTNNSVNSYLRATRAFMNHMMEKQYVDYYKIEIPKDKDKIVKCYTDADIKVLSTKPVTESFAEYRNYVICCILASTGMRVGSLVSILNEDVDLVNGIITLRHNKNGSIQVIHINKSLIGILSEYMEIVNGTSTDPLIVTYLGQAFDTRALSRQIRKYANKRGVFVEKYMHSFRYWYGMSLARQNVGAFTIMKLMGHKNIKTSQGYIERAGFDVKDKIDTINPFENLSTRKQSIKLTR